MGRRGGPAFLRGYSVSQVVLALALPFFAAGVQWLLFPLITPSVWILFYLTLFLSAWLAGFIGGVGSALIGTVLVFTLFIGPQANWVIGPNRILPTLLFLGMGVLFGEVHERLARAQDLLAEERDTTEAKFEGLVEQSLAGIYIAQNGLVTYANPEFARIFGYESPDDVLGLPSSDLVTANYASLVAGSSGTNEQPRGSGLRGELLGLRQDGTVVPIDVHGRTIEAEGQHMAIGVVIDRTEVLEARDTIRERDEMLDRTSEIGKIGGWELNVLTGEATWTAEAARIHDIQSEDAGWKTDPLFQIVPEMREFVREAQRRAIESGWPFDLETEIVTASGARKWVRIVGRPAMLGDQVVRVQGTIQDVSDKHAAEEALRRSEERYRTLVEQMPEGMFVLDASGRITDANPAASEMTGFTSDELRKLSAAELVRPQDMETLVTRFTTIGGPPVASHWILVRKDGSEFHAEVVGRRLPDNGVQAVVRDITERRRVEQLIRDLNSELERKVAIRTAEVEAANRELEAFAYAVSHDLRAPLRAMNGFCKALAEDYGESLDDRAHEYISFIMEGSRTMSELIDALLTLSRDTRGDMLHEIVDVTGLVNKVIAQRRQFYPERDVQVEVEENLCVFGDTRMVNVLVSNLVGNAWKYTMKTEAARVSITSTVDEDGKRWICVADNGAGFDTRYSSQLFEPFHRLHREDDFPGIGIGLATVKRIVNRHGGLIKAEAVPGRGATFSFWLPDADQLLVQAGGLDAVAG
ncbi:MAG TPA: PAS domain S-box protein [Coriobacteriia bacterium]|nr:PAS domain S-box protein [Coriobacteriia bacterium]